VKIFQKLLQPLREPTNCILKNIDLEIAEELSSPWAKRLRKIPRLNIVAGFEEPTRAT
jgi:hypothetical protein